MFQVWCGGFVVHSVVGMLAALMLKRDCILASIVIESPQTTHLSEPCRWVLYCWRLIWSRLCGIRGSLLDWPLSSLKHFVVSSSSSVTCKQRPLFFFFFIPSLLPRSHMSLSRLTPSSPPLCFHFKMFDFTYYLLLWFWAPAMLTCSSSPSLPPCLSHAILGHTFMRGLCCSLYLPSFYCLANSYSSEVARVSEGSPV